MIARLSSERAATFKTGEKNVGDNFGKFSMPDDAGRPNAQEIGNWNEQMGRSWALLHERLDRQIAPIGEAAMERAGFRSGEQVLDVGCGCGETSLTIAGRIAPGQVVGVDVSAMLLDIAARAAAAKGVKNVSFIEDDAQTHAFQREAFDVIFSRFGVMFFDDPTAAFTNLRRATPPGGRLAFCCWRNPRENLWLSMPMQAAGHLLPPLPPSDPNAPGPFAFADRDRVASILADAGFDQVDIQPFDTTTGAESLDDSVFLSMRVGQLGSALRQIGPDDELKRKVAEALRAGLQPYVQGGEVRMPAATWIVSARNR